VLRRARSPSRNARSSTARVSSGPSRSPPAPWS